MFSVIYRTLPPCRSRSVLVASSGGSCPHPLCPPRHIVSSHRDNSDDKQWPTMTTTTTWVLRDIAAWGVTFFLLCISLLQLKTFFLSPFGNNMPKNITSTSQYRGSSNSSRGAHPRTEQRASEHPFNVDKSNKSVQYLPFD